MFLPWWLRQAAAPTLAAQPEPEELTEEEVGKLPIVPHYDYAAMSEHVYGDGTPVPKGWRILLDCSEVNLNREGYWGTAYIHTEMKHVVIAERGTIDAAGLRAGIWVYFDEPTIQFALAEQFSKIVRLKLSLRFGSDDHFTVSYTGHSLGGVLATCRAVAEQTFGVAFETPGCKGFVEKVMHPFRFDDADVIVYLRPPNTINSLKPQVGLVVQLPPKEYTPVASAEIEENVQRKIAQMLPSFSFPNVSEFMGKKILERSVPELYDYIARLEPVIRELFDRTQQEHSIHNVRPLFEDTEGNYSEPECEIVDRWPSHLMQFFEYHSTRKSLEDVKPSEPHLRAAYDSLIDKIYSTKKYDGKTLPVTWLDTSSRHLIAWWHGLPAQARLAAGAPLTQLDRKVLGSTTLDSNGAFVTVKNKASRFTAFQLKQYLFIATQRVALRDFLSRLPPLQAIESQAKL
ncbi:hypothetical protein DIPPA_30373 [Diplonema papillatum]|nr:hypothetical protein DIPPA_30373 [Diplonema papillatum]